MQEDPLRKDELSLPIDSQPPVLDRIGDLAERDVLSAFVTFSRVRHRDFLLHGEYWLSWSNIQRHLQPQRLRFFGSSLQVEAPPAPSDIFWEHLDFPEARRRKRRRIVLLSCCLLLLVCFAMFSAAKKSAIEFRSYVAAPCGAGTAYNATADCKCIQAGYRQVLADEPEGIYEECGTWLRQSIKSGTITALAATAVVVINVATTPVVVLIADLERPASLTTRSHRVMSMVFLVQLINLGCITALVHLKLNINILGKGLFGLVGSGTFSDFVFEWYVVVGASVLLSMLLNTFCPLLGVLWAWILAAQRWCRRRRLRAKGHSRSELVELHKPPEFELAVQHAQQLCTIFVTLIFSAGMPLLMPLLVTCLTLSYWSDKYVLLRASCVPPRYKQDLMLWALRLLPLALLAHSAVAVWVFGREEVAPSYQLRGALRSFALDARAQVSSTALVGAIDRMFTVSSLPSVVVCAVLSCMLVLRLLRACLGRVRSAAGVASLLCCKRRSRITKGRNFTLSRAFHREPLEEMKRLKIAYSYNITDVPEYRFLAPAATEASDGRACSGKELHPIAMKFSPELVEASLTSKDWMQTVDHFFRLHCPRFRTFDPGNEECDIMMKTVHGEFCEALETMIKDKLKDMDLDEEDFAAILQRREADSIQDPSVARVLETLLKYEDFCAFGVVMRDKYVELHGSSKDAEGSPKVADVSAIALKFAPELMEASLSGDEWAHAMDTFFRSHCPRFRSFDPEGEFSDLMMTRVHDQFRETLEKKLAMRLQELGLSEESFAEILKHRLAEAPEDPQLQRLETTLSKYDDFREFGMVMRGKFEEYHASTEHPKGNSKLRL